LENPFAEFTEEGYVKHLKSAKSKYAFLSFNDALENKPGILWRHDIDASVHRAVKLAKLEHELGIFSTYFIYLHCMFYNVLEKEISQLISEISSLGHNIGLHFDPSYYDLTTEETERLKECVQKDKDILENTINIKASAISFHNPDASGNWLSVSMDKICGLPSAYAPAIQQNYVYCSDSNGYWRFKPLGDVLNENHLKLHVLTHPAIWAPEPISPRARTERCVDGRAEYVMRRYDEILESLGRVNLR